MAIVAASWSDGLLALYVAIQSRGQGVWALVLEGVIGIGAGLIAFFWPAITALALLYVIAARPIVTGVVELIAAVRLRWVITNEWALILGMPQTDDSLETTAHRANAESPGRPRAPYSTRLLHGSRSLERVTGSFQRFCKFSPRIGTSTP